MVRAFNPISSAMCVAGMLTCPELAANSYRLEKLVEHVLLEGVGNKRANAKDLTRLFTLLGELGYGPMEDPAEDVFVSLVHFEGRNYRVFEGLWEANAFHLQRLLNVVSTMPDEGPFDDLRRQISSLLGLSEQVAERRGLHRYSCGAEYPVQHLPREHAAEAARLGRSVEFTPEELRVSGIDPVSLDAFSQSVQTLRATYQGGDVSELWRLPLIKHLRGVFLALPANVSTAIRLRIIEFAKGAGQINTLLVKLAQEYTALIQDIPLLGGSSHAPLALRPHDGCISGECVQEVDTGRFIHYLFIMDDFEQFRSHGFLSMSPTFIANTPRVQKRLTDVVSEFSSRPGFREGLTIIVVCGWGRGLGMETLESGNKDWIVDGISIEQMETLSWSRDIRPLHLFRLFHHVEELEARGIHLANANGLLNLYSVAIDQGFHLAPHDAISPTMVQDSGELTLIVRSNALLDTRRQVASRLDVHVATPPGDNAILLRRYILNSFFQSDDELPLYASTQEAASGILRSVYEGDWLSVWLTCQTDSAASSDSQFRFWDGFSRWLAAVVPTIEQAVAGYTPIELVWHIQYEMPAGADAMRQCRGKSAAQLYDQITTRVDRERMRVLTIVPWEVYGSFNDPRNYAEQAVLRSLVEGVAQCMGGELDASKTVSMAVRSEDARHFHLLEAQEFGDYLADKIPRYPFLLEPFDDSLCRLGIAGRINAASAGDVILGIGESTKALNSVVDSIWNDVRSMLRKLDRVATIEKFMLNILSNNRQIREWEKTIRAVLALSADRDDAMRTAATRIFRHNVTGSACRYAVEMAMCECLEEGGEEPGELELARLIAHIQLICQYGGWSDGMLHGVIPAEIRISALGLLMISGEFYDDVVEPYGYGLQSDRLMIQAAGYESLFNPTDAAKPMADTTGQEFLDVWREEFGFTIDEARSFMDEIEDRAIQEGVPLVRISRADLIELASKHMPEESASRLIGEFTLHHRRAWDEPPEQYTDKDIVPWRFKRRLSLVHRPIVELNPAGGGECICSPELLRQGVALRVSRTYYAEYDDSSFSSPQMRSWVGTRRHELGHEFTRAMADVLEAAGWCTRLEITPSGILGQKLDVDYGDVDILGWKPESARVLVIECKNLFVAKTPSEIARQLADFRGQQDQQGKPDRLLRHLNRVALLRRHKEKVATFVGLDEIELESVLVFSNPVPIGFINNEAVKQVDIRYANTLADI